VLTAETLSNFPSQRKLALPKLDSRTARALVASERPRLGVAVKL